MSRLGNPLFASGGLVASCASLAVCPESEYASLLMAPLHEAVAPNDVRRRELGRRLEPLSAVEGDLRVAIGVAVVVVAVPIPLVEPLLIVPLQLVVEQHALDLHSALGEALGVAKVRAMDLEVVLQFPLAFEAVVKRLTVTLLAVTVAFQQPAPFSREHHRLLAMAGYPHSLDQPLRAEMPKVA